MSLSRLPCGCCSKETFHGTLILCTVFFDSKPAHAAVSVHLHSINSAADIVAVILDCQFHESHGSQDVVVFRLGFLGELPLLGFLFCPLASEIDELLFNFDFSNGAVRSRTVQYLYSRRYVCENPLLERDNCLQQNQCPVVIQSANHCTGQNSVSLSRSVNNFL